MSTPTCPNCGGHKFQFPVQQLIVVEFKTDDHRVVEGPQGDMEWSDETLVVCEGCGRCETLGAMTIETKRIRVRVIEEIVETTIIEMEVPADLDISDDTDENLLDCLEDAFTQGSYVKVEGHGGLDIRERDFDRVELVEDKS